jgi:maleate isomerase
MSIDLVAEPDMSAMAPEGATVHFTRLKTDDYATKETLARNTASVADAASCIQPDTRPYIISSCTSVSIVNGEAPDMAAIKKGAPYAQPMTLVTSVIDALRKLGVHWLVVSTPYLDEINTAEAEFLVAKGF